jgi:hypothetical protein
MESTLIAPYQRFCAIYPREFAKALRPYKPLVVSRRICAEVASALEISLRADIVVARWLGTSGEVGRWGAATLRSGDPMRIDPFIEAEEGAGRSVKHRCHLFEVSRAAHYQRKRHVPSPRQLADAQLLEEIHQVHVL